jgi:hypothetical protein
LVGHCFICRTCPLMSAESASMAKRILSPTCRAGAAMVEPSNRAAKQRDPE